jgi:hypothetical protein
MEIRKEFTGDSSEHNTRRGVLDVASNALPRGSKRCHDAAKNRRDDWSVVNVTPVITSCP